MLKAFLCFLFKFSEFLSAKHTLINSLLVLVLTCLVRISCCRSYTLRGRLIRSHHRTLGEPHTHEDFPISACFINTVSHKHSRTTILFESWFQTHIEDDVGSNFLQTLLGTIQFIDGRPTLFQLKFSTFSQSVRFVFKPQINLILAGQILINIPCFITKVKNYAIFDTFIEFIGMNVCTEGFQACLLVCFQKRSTCKTNQDRIRHQHFYGLMQFAGVGTMTLIDKCYDISLCNEVLRKVFQ